MEFQSLSSLGTIDVTYGILYYILKYFLLLLKVHVNTQPQLQLHVLYSVL